MGLRRLGEVMVGHADPVTGIDMPHQIVEQWAEFQVYDIIEGRLPGMVNDGPLSGIERQRQAPVLQFVHPFDAGIGSEQTAHARLGDPLDMHVLPELDTQGLDDAGGAHRITERAGTDDQDSNGAGDFGHGGGIGGAGTSDRTHPS